MVDTNTMSNSVEKSPKSCWGKRKMYVFTMVMVVVVT